MTNDKIKKALYNIDKWMPEDFELQREYYQLINDKDQKGMEEFLDMYADQDRLMRYGIQYEDLGKLSEAIITGSNYADGGMMAEGGEVAKKGQVKIGDSIYKVFYNDWDGEDFSVPFYANSEKEAISKFKNKYPHIEYYNIGHAIKINTSTNFDIFEEMREYADGGMMAKGGPMDAMMSKVTHYDVTIYGEPKKDSRNWISIKTFEHRVKTNNKKDAISQAKLEFAKLYPNEKIDKISANPDLSASIPDMPSLADGGDLSTKYIAYIEESRRPGGSDRSIKKTYNLDVEDRTSDGFYIAGAKEDIEDFINDYSINFAKIELYKEDGDMMAKGGKTSGLVTITSDAYFGGDGIKDVKEHISNIEKKFKIEIKPTGQINNDGTQEYDITGKKKDILNFLADDSYDEDEFGMGFSDDEIEEFYPELFEDGGYMAKGGEMSDEKTILKIQNMMGDEKMTLKLQKEFEGKDLFDDEIVDEYLVKQFDYSEDSDNIEKFIRMKKNKFYVVPFDNQDDSYYYILVPKDKMAKGGATSDIYVLGSNYEIRRPMNVDDDDLAKALKKYKVEMYFIDEEGYGDAFIKLIGEKDNIENLIKDFNVWNIDANELNDLYLKIKKYQGKLDPKYNASRYMKQYYKDLYSDEDYAKGGKLKSNAAKFSDKVKAISKKLAGTKVPKKYKKDYGATYDKQEANTAARKISGAKLAELRAKLAKKTKTKRK
jgi:hypothetical protein